MKSEIKESENIKIEYPYLGHFCLNNHDDTKVIVLFTEKNTGICIYHPLDKSQIGKIESDCLEMRFKKFNGQVILSNESI